MSTDSKWTVYKVRFVKGTRKLTELGTVTAPHQPAALGKAFNKWPDDVDPRQVQGGFTVRKIPNSMSVEEYIKLCTEVGVATPALQSAFFGISLRTAQTYAVGATIPEPVAKLLRLAARLKLKPEDVK